MIAKICFSVVSNVANPCGIQNTKMQKYNDNNSPIILDFLKEILPYGSCKDYSSSAQSHIGEGRQRGCRVGHGGMIEAEEDGTR